MQSQTQSPLPSSTPSPSTSNSNSSSPPQSRRSAEVKAAQRRSGSYEEGERLVIPPENAEPEIDPSNDPALHAIVLPQPVPVDLKELELWAMTSKYAWAETHRRVYDPKRIRPDMDVPEMHDDPASRETIILIDALGKDGASVVATTLGTGAFTSIARTVPDAFPCTKNLFQSFAKIAKTTADERKKGSELIEQKQPQREEMAEERGVEETLQVNPLTTTPVTEAEMLSALPIPEGTCGVFHVGKDASIDISSAGFASCVGVVLVARHQNGSRTIGLAHLNTDAAERQLASFSSFVAAVSGDGKSPLDVWLVGGGRGEPSSITLALSLFEFFAGLKIATSLFQSDERHSYVVHDTPEGTELHEHEGKSKKMDARETQLAAVHPVFRAASKLSLALGISVPELLMICDVDRQHPLMQQVSNQN